MPAQNIDELPGIGIPNTRRSIAAGGGNVFAVRTVRDTEYRVAVSTQYAKHIARFNIVLVGVLVIRRSDNRFAIGTERDAPHDGLTCKFFEGTTRIAARLNVPQARRAIAATTENKSAIGTERDRI